MNLEDILSKLQEWFPPEDHKERKLPGGGRWFFVPHQAITQRLNTICPGHWHTKINSTTIAGDYTVVILELTICGVTRTGIGDDKAFPELNEQGKSKVIGTPPVRAFRSAFKDAAEQFGICAYLDDQKDNRNAFVKYMSSKGDMRAYKFAQENSEVAVGARGVAKPRPAPEVQSPTINPKYPIPEPQTDRELLMKEIDSLCARKQITPDIGRDILMELYGVKGRSQLSNQQLIGFRDYLAVRPNQAVLSQK